MTNKAMNSLKQALLLQDGGIISIVGAGGKTSLMFALAKELTDTGDAVLTTTTTRIYAPLKDQSAQVVVADSEADLLHRIRASAGNHPHITAARRYSHDRQKLIGIRPGTVDKLWKTKTFDWIIVEADGAAQKPIKAPADHEPVIPEDTRVLVIVAGLSVIGHPLSYQWVHRPDRFSRLTGLEPESAVIPSAIADAIIHEKGGMKGAPKHAVIIAWLNQADRTDSVKNGREIVKTIMTRGGVETGLYRIIIATLLGKPRIIDCIDL